MQHILNEIAARYKLRKSSNRFAGSCPKCGGSERSDRFSLYKDGGFICFGCGWKGDVITLLRELENMSCPEAHEAADRECRLSDCPVRGTCRMGDGSGKPRRMSRRPLAPKSDTGGKPKLPATTIKSPASLWADWAEKLTSKAAAAIKDQPEAISWLASRGIDATAIVRYRLGWLNHDRKVKRAKIGLKDRNGKDYLWVPSGLLIPTLSNDNTVHRLRVRRTADSRERFLPDLKYVWLEGSGNSPMVLMPSGKNRGIVVVEAELDAMAVATAHTHVTVIALGTVRAGLPARLREMCQAAPVILVSLDADTGRDGKPGPGPEAISAWLKEYRHAKFWPVPDGKDPGEYAQRGGDLHAWIEAGLIPEVPVARKTASSPEMPHRGEGDVDNNTSDEVPVSRVITLKNGKSFHVVEDRGLWEQLAAEGEVVFSENELLRLKAACAECDPEDAAILANAVLDLKSVFATEQPYIKRGGGVV